MQKMKRRSKTKEVLEVTDVLVREIVRHRVKCSSRREVAKALGVSLESVKLVSRYHDVSLETWAKLRDAVTRLGWHRSTKIDKEAMAIVERTRRPPPMVVSFSDTVRARLLPRNSSEIRTRLFYQVRQFSIESVAKDLGLSEMDLHTLLGRGFSKEKEGRGPIPDALVQRALTAWIRFQGLELAVKKALWEKAEDERIYQQRKKDDAREAEEEKKNPKPHCKKCEGEGVILTGRADLDGEDEVIPCPKCTPPDPPPRPRPAFIMGR